MLKWILFLLSEYYFEIFRENSAEILANIKKKAPWVEVELRKAEGQDALSGQERILAGETLLITDLPEAANQYLEKGWYLAALYHEKNQGLSFPGVRYAIEDVSALEYRSYEEVYKRLAGIPWDILETKRLQVRESILQDVDEFYRIYREPAITRYMENLFPEKEAELAYMKAYISQIYGFYGYGLWSVLLKEEGRVIGRAGLSVREGYEFPELGLVIEAAYQKKGYGFEVCAAILEYARRELAFDRVQALVKEGNAASKKLLKRLGFLYERNVYEKEGEYELHTIGFIKT